MNCLLFQVIPAGARFGKFCRRPDAVPHRTMEGEPEWDRFLARSRTHLRPANAGLSKLRKETETRIRREWRRRALPILAGRGRCMSARPEVQCRAGEPA